MCRNYLYVCMYYVCMYVCTMYVWMYTMILPLHFSLPIYSPWQKNHKIKRGAGPLPGPESYLVPHFTNFTKNTLKKNEILNINNSKSFY